MDSGTDRARLVCVLDRFRVNATKINHYVAVEYENEPIAAVSLNSNPWPDHSHTTRACQHAA
jgi:hypothetical protein